MVDKGRGAPEMLGPEYCRPVLCDTELYMYGVVLYEVCRATKCWFVFVFFVISLFCVC